MKLMNKYDVNIYYWNLFKHVLLNGHSVSSSYIMSIYIITSPCNGVALIITFISQLAFHVAISITVQPH